MQPTDGCLGHPRKRCAGHPPIDFKTLENQACAEELSTVSVRQNLFAQFPKLLLG